MSDEFERRRGYANIERLLAELAETVKEHSHEIHKHDRTIAVLETQAKIGEERTCAVEAAIRAIHEKIDELSECFSRKMDTLVESLAAHTRQEDKDRVKLLMAVVATLATGLASLAFEVIRRG